MTTNTAQAIIGKAYIDSMKVSKGGALTSAQLTDGLERLQDIVNLDGVRGLKLFLETEVPVTLVALQQVYSFRPGGDVNMTRPLRVKDAVYVSANGQIRSLLPFGRTDWAQQSARSEPGTINRYFADRLYDRLNLYLWNVPDVAEAAGTLRVTLAAAAGTQALALTTAFPPEWVIYLRYALASDLSAGMPMEVINRNESKAAEFRMILEDADVEDAPTMLQPTYPQYGAQEFNS